MIPTYRPSLGPEELQAVAQVFASRHLGRGDVTRQFEQQLAQFLGARHVIGVDHGTSALHLALDVLDLKPGDEVIVPSLTFVATVQAICLAGAVPVFCEVRPETLNLDLDDARRRITPRTRAILPVHFGGLPCEMEPLLQEAGNRGLRVVEDAAHAFGATCRGRHIGAVGDLTCFSFDAIKNITCGEGGAVVTQDDELARRLRGRRRLGIDEEHRPGNPAEQGWQYHVLTHGFRYHMSDLNAAIGLEQLKKFPAFQQRKREIMARYDAAFEKLPGVRTVEHNLNETCPWAYVLRVLDNRRDEFRSHLRQGGIQTLIQFIPNHLQPAFAPFRVPLPVTEQLHGEIVSLPLFVETTDPEVEQVVEAVQAFPWRARSTGRSATGGRGPAVKRKLGKQAALEVKD